MDKKNTEDTLSFFLNNDMLLHAEFLVSKSHKE